MFSVLQRLGTGVQFSSWDSRLDQFRVASACFRTSQLLLQFLSVIVIASLLIRHEKFCSLLWLDLRLWCNAGIDELERLSEDLTEMLSAERCLLWRSTSSAMWWLWSGDVMENDVLVARVFGWLLQDTRTQVDAGTTTLNMDFTLLSTPLKYSRSQETLSAVTDSVTSFLLQFVAWMMGVMDKTRYLFVSWLVVSCVTLLRVREMRPGVNEFLIELERNALVHVEVWRPSPQGRIQSRNGSLRNSMQWIKRASQMFLPILCEQQTQSDLHVAVAFTWCIVEWLSSVSRSRVMDCDTRLPRDVGVLHKFLTAGTCLLHCVSVRTESN